MPKGVDASDSQINEANAKEHLPNVHYRVGTSDNLPFEDESLELLTAAQAAHWFDLDKFYAEVNRVLKPNGVLALYGYGLPQASCPQRPESPVNRIVQQFYEEKCFWTRHRLDVKSKYENYRLPFPDWIRNDSMKIECEWSVNEYVSYMSTSSGFRRHLELHPTETDPLDDLRRSLVDALSANERQESADALSLNVTFDVFLLMGRKPPNWGVP